MLTQRSNKQRHKRNYYLVCVCELSLRLLLLATWESKNVAIVNCTASSSSHIHCEIQICESNSLMDFSKRLHIVNGWTKKGTQNLILCNWYLTIFSSPHSIHGWYLWIEAEEGWQWQGRETDAIRKWNQLKNIIFRDFFGICRRENEKIDFR